MIKALRVKFICTTMALLILVISVMLAVLNIIFQHDIRQTALQEMYSLSAAERVPRFKLREDTEEEDELIAEIEADETQTGSTEDSVPPPIPVPSESPDSGTHRSWTDDMAFKEMYAVFTDESGNIVKWVRMFEYGPEESELTSLVEEAFSRSREDGQVGSYLYLKTQKQNGTLIILRNYSGDLASCRQMMFRSVSIGVAALAVLFVITFLLAKKVTQPAERAFRQQKQFIADASHELKTPLSAIAINADVLKGEIGSNRWLNNIISECGQMEELVLSLLTLAKLEAVEKLPLEKQELDFSSICQEAALSFESIAYEKGIQLNEDVQEKIRLSGNRSELKRLVTALLDNALKYVDAHGTVSISLKKQEQKAILCVSNTGPDIDPESLPHLFERFYRVDASRTGEKSFGLGLAIASEIVSHHGGKIGVTSSGGKTVFTVTL